LAGNINEMTVKPSATKPSARSILTIVLFAIYALVVIGVILFKFPFSYQEDGSGRVLNLIPLAGSYRKDGVLRVDELIENVLIFVPLGLYLSMVKRAWSFWRRSSVIVGVTVAFEIIQYIFAIGRADITDVLTNAIGGMLGIGLYALLSRALKAKTNRIINVVALFLTVAALLELGFLLSHAR
jgi:glycopeptide antibiotics resistance protein